MTIWVTFYGAIWQDNLIFPKETQVLTRKSIYRWWSDRDGRIYAWHRPQLMIYARLPWWRGRYISDTPDNREIFGKNIALW